MIDTRCFTPKEKLVYELLLSGLSYKEIASRLGIKYRTLNCHACSIYRKLGFTRKTGELLKSQEAIFGTPATHLCKSKEQRIKVYQLRKEGFKIEEIAVKLMISKDRVYSYLHSIRLFLKKRRSL